MPELDTRWFNTGNQLARSLVPRIQVTSFGAPVDQALKDLGWNGSDAVAGLGLELSPDCQRVQDAQFLLRGKLAAEPVVRPAASIWKDAAKDVSLQVEIPNGGRFRFSNGSLASDYLSCDEAKIRFSRGDAAILPCDWAAAGVGDFALRVICHLDKRSNQRQGPLIKFVVLLVPLSIDELSQNEASTSSSAWPGFKLAEDEARFCPITDRDTWGDPICPLLMHNGRADATSHTPPADEMRFQIASVMRTARLAVTCKTANGWLKQRDKAEEDISNMEKQPLITWPAAPRHAAPQGSYQITLPVFTILSFLK